jgi:hypothetical protein
MNTAPDILCFDSVLVDPEKIQQHIRDVALLLNRPAPYDANAHHSRTRFHSVGEKAGHQLPKCEAERQ